MRRVSQSRRFSCKRIAATGKKRSCPWQVLTFYLVMVLWLILILQRALFPGRAATAAVSMAMNDTTLPVKWEVSISGHTPVSYSQQDAQRLVYSIARELRVQAEETPVVVEQKQNGWTVGYDLAGARWECKVKYYYMRELDQGYLTIRMGMEQRPELCETYEEQIRKLQQEYRLDGMVLVQYECRRPRMTQQEKEAWKQKLFADLNAKTAFENAQEDLMISYGYSRDRKEYLMLGTRPVNVNVAFFDNVPDQSVIMVGIPYLPFDR